jgi:hypothetical protein
MARKTVLAHCNDKARVRRVLDPAVEVAGAFQAHLVGLSITPPIVIVPAACVAPMSHAASDIGAH